jgi:hypothetical protein
MVAEALLLLWIGWSRFGLATDDNALYTFSFLLLLYFAEFSVVSVRERRPFWSSRPSQTLLAASLGDIAVGTGITRLGLPGLTALPWPRTGAIFAYVLISSLVVNDTLKVAMIKWRFPSLVARKRAE